MNTGGLILLTGFLDAIGSRIEKYIKEIGGYIAVAIEDVEDDSCSRLACGLVSDIANNLDKRIVEYLGDYMARLNKVLSSSEFTTETKLHAIGAVGDVCLAAEEGFHPYLDETMQCLKAAAQVSTEIVDPEDVDKHELFNRFRHSLIDSFMAILHGMPGI